MSKLFTPQNIGRLTLPNRLIRSATAERMADGEGRPGPALAALYRDLALGGVGLIVTGHLFVHPSGRAHAEMTGIHSDDLIPDLAALVDATHRAGGRVAAQVNHGGMQCSRDSVAELIAPSAVEADDKRRPAREMTLAEIETIVDAFAQAARRAQAAGFDAVQLHAAHGYLISQFLSPLVNRRSDEWGGDLAGRMRFLRAVCEAARAQVGPDYPLFVKLGVMDGAEDGLTLDEGKQVVAALAGMGLDAVELSGGLGGRHLNIPTAIRAPEDEAYFRPLAKAVRPVTDLPIALVGGFRSRAVMDEVLDAGDADMISLCRPLICEPDLPERMRRGVQERALCISCNRCWPDQPGAGVACKGNVDRTERGE